MSIFNGPIYHRSFIKSSIKPNTDSSKHLDRLVEIITFKPAEENGILHRKNFDSAVEAGAFDEFDHMLVHLKDSDYTTAYCETPHYAPVHIKLTGDNEYQGYWNLVNGIDNYLQYEDDEFRLLGYSRAIDKIERALSEWGCRTCKKEL